MKYVMSKFSIKNLIIYLKDMLGMSRLIGFINKESGRQSIYGYLLDTKSAQSRTGVLCIDDEKYDIECNIYHENIEKKFGHGNHGYKLYIPYKHKDGNEHVIKLLDKETMKACAERKIQLKKQKDTFDIVNDEICTNLYSQNIQQDSLYVNTQYNELQNSRSEDNAKKFEDIQNIIGKTVSLDEKIFLIEKSDSENQSCIALRNISTGLYLQIQDGKVVETKQSNNALDCTSQSRFIPEPRGDGFVLRCASTGFEEYYICKLDIDTYIVSEDLVEYVFYVQPESEKTSEYNMSQSENFENYNDIDKSELSISEKNNHETSDNDLISHDCSDGYCCSEEIFGCTICINGTNYIIVPANDGSIDHISLLNISNGCYILAYDDKIIDKASDMSRWFNHNSSFIAESINENICLHRINKNNNNSSIVYSKKNEEYTIGMKSQAYVFAKEHSYKQWENIKTILSILGSTFSKIKY